MDYQPTWIITQPVAWGPGAPTSAEEPCTRCHQPVWVNPTSRPVQREGGQPVCIPCARRYLREHPGARPRIDGLTAAQREEIRLHTGMSDREIDLEMVLFLAELHGTGRG